ncbi:hypothetical protein Tco_0313026 [Tanacetum coccineum]
MGVVGSIEVTIHSWDFPEKTGIQNVCSTNNDCQALEEIRNFKQEGDETLYQAWERYNDLLYKSPFSWTSIAAAEWHDETSNKNIESSGDSEGIAAIVSKLDSLGRDIKKLKENAHAIQVRCQNCGGAHLDKVCPLNEEVKSVKEAKYGELTTLPFSASVNVIPKTMFEQLKLAQLKKTDMLVEMADMTKRSPLGIKSEEEERQELGINIEEYDPPIVHVETFEIKRYSFDSGQNFICVTKELIDALPLGRENGVLAIRKWNSRSPRLVFMW